MNVFDDRSIRRVQIGTDRPPARSPTEQQAQRLADQAATESRLKAAEAIWRTVQQAASGGVAPAPRPAATGNPETGEVWTGHPDDFRY